MRRLIGGAAALSSMVASPAVAGPPFLTDDPVPTDLGRWEVYGYGEASVFRHRWEGEAGIDVNYGGFRDTQLSATLPYASHADGVNRLALGDVEVGVKYRILHQAGGIADVSFFPAVSIPTGGARGSGRVGGELPVWAQRDMGRWSLFGGGGYAINPGAGRRNYWFAGATLTRQLTHRLSFGGEVFRQGRDAVDSRAATLAGLGATWAAAKRWSLLAAGDTSFGSGAAAHGRRIYLALLFHT